MSTRKRRKLPSFRCAAGWPGRWRPAGHERSGLPVGGPDRVDPDPVPDPTKGRQTDSKSFLLVPFKTRLGKFLSVPAFAHPPKPIKLCVDHPPAPPLRSWPLSVNGRSQAAALHPHWHSQAPLWHHGASLAQPGAFTPASVYASRASLLNGWSGRCFPVDVPARRPATNPHARTGFSAALDTFAVSASRNPGTPDFSKVLHEHAPLSPLDSAPRLASA